MLASAVIAVVFPCLVAAGVPRDRVWMARFIEVEERADSVIPALLRTPHSTRRGADDLAVRQSTCETGYLECDDGNGCCPIGDYCGTWSGKLGCCEIGKTCIANNNPCDYVGYTLCSGEDFCCPAGDTCSRDSLGNAKCSDGSGSGSDDFSSYSIPSYSLPSYTSYSLSSYDYSSYLSSLFGTTTHSSGFAAATTNPTNTAVNGPTKTASETSQTLFAGGDDPTSDASSSTVTSLPGLGGNAALSTSVSMFAVMGCAAFGAIMTMIL